ncbi:hypothetical protein DM02DRAFT_603071 [Periconia macrospinosa]|uniref:Uncharacterized protein n=1 Tax=Periconia macrospinosa TaxID=97972 RepID=A0A2V1DA47_9PLEO|nr:hypothetical protein DM02DRAFT_603071 [Periconia macrospinosa]
MYNALIRTHHITSRKKISKLTAAASHHNIYALLRYGGAPGIMYCQGRHEAGVKGWIADVKRLRYKDFQLVRKPGLKEGDGDGEGKGEVVRYGRLEEVESVKEFGARMEGLGVWEWWRAGMGFVGEKG